MKTSSLRLVSAPKDVREEFDSLKKDTAELEHSKPWIRRVPQLVRNTFYGITAATMLFFVSQSYAHVQIPEVPGEPGVVENAAVEKPQQQQPQAPPANAGVVHESQPQQPSLKDESQSPVQLPSIELSNELKEKYISYKKGDVKEKDMNAAIASEAAIIVKNKDPTSFARVVEELKSKLENWCNCNDKCKNAKPKSVKAKPAKPVKKGKGKPPSTKEGKAAVAGKPQPKEISKEEYEKNICKNCENEKQPTVVIVKRLAEEKDVESGGSKPLQSGDVESGESKPLQSGDVESGESKPPALNVSVGPTNESSKKQPSYYELAVPFLGGYLQALDPYGKNLTQMYGTTPFMLSFLLNNPNLGFSVLGGYNGRFYEFDGDGGTVYSRHSSLAGIGPYLRLDDTSISVLATLDGDLNPENLGLMALVSSDKLNLILRTQFRSDKPTMFALHYWDPKSTYPLILDMQGSLTQVNDLLMKSEYSLFYTEGQLQIPLLKGASVYPNLVIGGLYHCMNADPNEKCIVGGKVGLSLTYDWLNIGATYNSAVASTSVFVPGEGTYEKGGVAYNGTLIKSGNDYISGFSAFLRFKLLPGINSDNLQFIGGLTYTQVGNNIFVGVPLQFILRW
ncbi:MAG: hypothetical protein N3G76_01325 [Candidatus Micrarchaeota archaeon]|nr:hypothetical protein [Candidatus Micrarchaeota archaeon]